jgi:DNA-binding NtrC family response regulator
MRVLVVDDERTIRETLKEILEDEGFEVFTEELGSRVLERVRELSPDILILDLFLPGISGMEVLKKMNEEGLTDKVSVIIVSGHGTVETAVRAMKLGAFDFIEKPIKYEKFFNAIQSAVSRRKQEKTLNKDYSNLPLRQAKEKFERDYIISLLKRFNGDLKKTASFMEIDISNLYRKLNKYGIDHEENGLD